jgi:hypothetical protein
MHGGFRQARPDLFDGVTLTPDQRHQRHETLYGRGGPGPFHTSSAVGTAWPQGKPTDDGVTTRVLSRFLIGGSTWLIVQRVSDGAQTVIREDDYPAVAA